MATTHVFNRFNVTTKYRAATRSGAGKRASLPMPTDPELDKLILLEESTNGFRNHLGLLPKKDS
jgi:hypothetical protein